MSSAQSILTLNDAKYTSFSMASICETVGIILHVSPVEIKGKRKLQCYVHARNIVCWFARKFSGRTYTEIGRFLNRDHSTCVVGFQKIERNFADYREILKAVAKVQGVVWEEKFDIEFPPHQEAA